MVLLVMISALPVNGDLFADTDSDESNSNWYEAVVGASSGTIYRSNAASPSWHGGIWRNRTVRAYADIGSATASVIY